ncbi:MAG: polysaccharide biosynthesis/export family protein [Phycisphaerae bacterium]|nr:polysaccharide biosynthesis/export family protein [Phycisphaerae bacterium]
MGKALITTGVGWLILTGVGCSSTNKDLRYFLDANKVQVSAIEYRVSIPDAILIRAPRILEVDGLGGNIHPDGKITLPLLGDVKVVGMTAKEIALKLTELLRPYYKTPKVQVVVTGYNSKKFYVFGMVGGSNSGMGGTMGGTDFSGGARPYTGRDTLLDVLAGSGMSFLAWRSRIKIIRASPDKDERKTITIDLDRMIKKGDLTQNVLLEPNDIVYVPPTPLGWVGLRLQELLFPFSPIVQAYQYPASIMSANNVYENDDDDD